MGTISAGKVGPGKRIFTHTQTTWPKGSRWKSLSWTFSAFPFAQIWQIISGFNTRSRGGTSLGSIALAEFLARSLVFRKARSRLELRFYSFLSKRLELDAGLRTILASSGLSGLDIQSSRSAWAKENLDSFHLWAEDCQILSWRLESRLLATQIN